MAALSGTCRYYYLKTGNVTQGDGPEVPVCHPECRLLAEADEAGRMAALSKMTRVETKNATDCQWGGKGACPFYRE